jgi:hypothetical protein
MIVVVVVVIVVVFVFVVLDYCWLFYIFIYEKNYYYTQQSRGMGGSLKCYSLGPQNAEIQLCSQCLIHINNHNLTSYNAARWLEVAIRNG